MNENHVEILADWGDLIAIKKPAGWLTVPGRGNKTEIPVLSHELGKQLRGSATRSNTSPDLFVIHRLDEGTSGVLLFARTANAHRELSLIFESRDMHKTYWAIVKGTPPKQIIDLPLFKLPSKRVKSVVDSKGKPSQTRIAVKITQDQYSVVEATPLTGRSHQIRVHLAHIGFPIVGDSLYGGPQEVFGKELKYPLLHARTLRFEWPKGTVREVTAQVEGPFLQTLEALGISPSCSVR